MEKAETKQGFILMNARGLRRLADSLEELYSDETIIKLPVWQDAHEPLYFQMDKGTGEINCIDYERKK